MAATSTATIPDSCRGFLIFHLRLGDGGRKQADGSPTTHRPPIVRFLVQARTQLTPCVKCAAGHLRIEIRSFAIADQCREGARSERSVSSTRPSALPRHVATNHAGAGPAWRVDRRGPAPPRRWPNRSISVNCAKPILGRPDRVPPVRYSSHSTSWPTWTHVVQLGIHHLANPRFRPRRCRRITARMCCQGTSFVRNTLHYRSMTPSIHLTHAPAKRWVAPLQQHVALTALSTERTASAALAGQCERITRARTLHSVRTYVIR